MQYKIVNIRASTFSHTQKNCVEGQYREVVLGVGHALLRGDREQLEGALDVLVHPDAFHVARAQREMRLRERERLEGERERERN